MCRPGYVSVFSLFPSACIHLTSVKFYSNDDVISEERDLVLFKHSKYGDLQTAISKHKRQQ